MAVREVTEQMNSDMFDNEKELSYPIENFSALELQQAIECFYYNGYKSYQKNGLLFSKKIS